MISFHPVIGQNDTSADLIMIQGTIQNYFDGWMTGDTTLLSKAMHATCNLKFVRDGKLVRVDKKGYVGNFKPRPRLPDTEARIISIDITRNAASAKVEIVTPKRHFTDYFNLLKEAGEWYITDKVSTNISR
tara:strand:- start:415 stop:807 length:393 start_codon:yes stop_codon:yes gene_type:complete